ncbi:MAG: methylated-DNA--[protein]-cysteine S-methyltransferase [Bythopirellula sp.]|nr:methylated-DNA--[protein]-cysteine S-methyltransferase [Bythopirellula sp.]
MISAFATQLGYMALATLDGELIGLSFGHPSERAARQSLERFYTQSGGKLLKQSMLESSTESTLFNDRLIESLTRFADGEAVEFDDVVVSLDGMTEFQTQVIAACRAIPWGETVSYGELAAQVGHPGAARAVGTVMSKNRVPLVVPCHRVLASGGNLGGYSAPQGLAMKRKLLELERQSQAMVTH